MNYPHELSAHYGRTIYAVDIAGDLRATFCVEGDTVAQVLHHLFDDADAHDLLRLFGRARDVRCGNDVRG